MILAIREWDDVILREPAQPVEKINLKLIDDMMETMYAIGAVGLAANQIGVPERILLIDRASAHKPPIIAVNPKIVAWSELTEVHGEGCFSLPGVYGMVRRPAQVTLEAQNSKGEHFSRTLLSATWEGVIAQHELDHLDGIFFTDYATEIWDDPTSVTATYKK